MVFEDFSTFEQRAITLRNALHGIVYIAPTNNIKQEMFRYNYHLTFYLIK